MIRTPSDVSSLFVRPQLRNHLYQILGADSLDLAASYYACAIQYWNIQYFDYRITSQDLANYCVYLADAYRTASLAHGGYI